MRLLGARRARQFEQTAISCLADVYRFARQISDENRAEDLVQETFLRAWKYFDTFEQGTNCRAWLLKILHNVWADQWRQPRPEIHLADGEEALIEPYYDWEDEFIKDELSQDVGIALSQLTRCIAGPCFSQTSKNSLTRKSHRL